MKVHCDEGVANHIGPEPCTVVREGKGEASAGERTGQPLSRERILIPGADAVARSGRPHGRMRQREHPPARRGRRPWHVRKLLGREPGGLTLDRASNRVRGPHREGEEP